MGDIGTAISSGSIPSVGTAGTTYASNLNLFLTEVKARLEAKVPRTSLADGALDLNGEPVQNADYLGMAEQGGTPTTPTGSLQRYDNNLWWINDGGAVQITDGTSLNTALLGGITGDYGGVNPAQFRFVDADQTYYAYDDYAGGAWGKLWARHFDVAAGATSSNRARIAYGGAGSYTITLPPAAPASTKALVMSSSGDITADTTFPFTLNTVRVTQSTERFYQVASCAMHASGTHTYDPSGLWLLGNSSTDIVAIPITLIAETDRIVEVGCYIKKNSDATNTITMRLVSIGSTGTRTTIGTDTNATNAGGEDLLTLDGLTTTAALSTQYLLEIIQSDSTPSSVDYVRNAYFVLDNVPV